MIAFVSKICFILLSICLSLCQYHTILTDVKSITLSVFLLLKFGLIILGSWHFPMKFRISLSVPTMKMSAGIFDWGCNKSKNQFGENWHLYHIESASPLKRYITLCLLHLWSSMSVCLCCVFACVLLALFPFIWYFQMLL